MSRPSSTSRFPAGCGSPNRGIIHACQSQRHALPPGSWLAWSCRPQAGPRSGTTSPSQSALTLCPGPRPCPAEERCREAKGLSRDADRLGTWRRGAPERGSGDVRRRRGHPLTFEEGRPALDALGSSNPTRCRSPLPTCRGSSRKISIGVGWASLKNLPSPSPKPTLELIEVDATLRRIGGLSGAGSQAARRTELEDLFSKTTEAERTFLLGLLMGEIRQGALEGVMVDAVARRGRAGARGAPRRDALRRPGRRVEGRDQRWSRALARFHLSVLTPVQPMLAQSADGIAAALEGSGRPPSVEARRRPAPGPSEGRRGARLHPEPRRRHGPRARDRRRDPRGPDRLRDRRRGGDRPQRTAGLTRSA